MAPPVLAPLPPVLKPIQHYLKTASEHDVRDPIIAYWCRLYALQQGLKLDRKSKESLAVLLVLMDWLEQEKKALQPNEAISSEMVAQAHLENYALKLFQWADSEDRASHFNKNVVKAFYTAGMLMDVLTTFGELSEDIAHHRKYAKWKAAYIHNCLKSGETPIPGPQSDMEDEFAAMDLNSSTPNVNPTSFPPPPQEQPQPQDFGFYTPNPYPPQPPTNFQQPSQPYNPPPPPQQQHYNPPAQPESSSHVTPSTTSLTAEQLTRAGKLCKFAGSALTYEDVGTAIENLEKALRLLKTGSEN